MSKTKTDGLHFACGDNLPVVVGVDMGSPGGDAYSQVFTIPGFVGKVMQCFSWAGLEYDSRGRNWTRRLQRLRIHRRLTGRPRSRPIFPTYKTLEEERALWRVPGP